MTPKKNDRPDAGTPERSEESIVADEILSEGEPPTSGTISDFSPSVKDLLHLNVFHENTGLMAKDLVAIVSEDYPSFSKQSFCMCEKPDKYGVVLHPAAFEKLQRMFPHAAVTKKKKKSGKNKLTKRISARLSDAEYDALIRKTKADGFDTMQAFLVFMVRNYLKEG